MRGFFSCNLNGPLGRGPKGWVSAEQALSPSLLLKVWALTLGLTNTQPGMSGWEGQVDTQLGQACRVL